MTKTAPKIRIVHPGGPAVMAQVWIDDQQLTCVTRVEIAPLDVDNNGPVTATLTVIDPEIALEAELAELVVRELPQPSTGSGDEGLSVIASSTHGAVPVTPVYVADSEDLYWVGS